MHSMGRPPAQHSEGSVITGARASSANHVWDHLVGAKVCEGVRMGLGIQDRVVGGGGLGIASNVAMSSRSIADD